MIRNSFRRRPELEAMESKLLLSGVAETHLSLAAGGPRPLRRFPPSSWSESPRGRSMRWRRAAWYTTTRPTVP